MELPVIYNCHIHTFTSSHLPIRFPPMWLKHLMRIKFARGILIYLATRFGLLLKLFEFILPAQGLSGSLLTIETLKRYERFFVTGMQKSQAEIFKNISSQYPETTRFIVLPMDMEFMGAGRPFTSYREQLEELAVLRKANPDAIIPFFAADPRRPGLFEMFTEFIEHRGFRGVKIYPNLGYFPDDPALMELYAVCQKKNIPVLAHCSPGGISQRGLTKEAAKAFAHPSNYKPILKEFPRLNFCLAHFGGVEEWERSLSGQSPRSGEGASWLTIILEMLRSGEYPNLYTDVSYTLFCEAPTYRPFSYADYLKVMMSDPNVCRHVLFGSDYYMVEQEKLNEKEVSIALRSHLGESLYFQMAHHNPKNFLYETTPAYPESEVDRRISNAWHTAL
ncbi:MAG: amidohydrolase family protein [Chloroflexi bacterium]|nr:amidohydrolase family protein [Chloroflexota bacterium]